MKRDLCANSKYNRTKLYLLFILWVKGTTTTYCHPNFVDGQGMDKVFFFVIFVKSDR